MHLALNKKKHLYIFSLVHYGHWQSVIVLTCRVDACCGATGKNRSASRGVDLPPRKEMKPAVSPRSKNIAHGKKAFEN